MPPGCNQSVLMLPVTYVRSCGLNACFLTFSNLCSTMPTELFAGLLSLVLLVLIVRGEVIPNLLRVCTLGSGIALFVMLHEFYRGWAAGGDVLGSFWGNARAGYFVALGLLVGTLARFAMLPFSKNWQQEIPGHDTRGRDSLSVHVLVWLGGGILIRLFVLNPPIVLDGRIVLTRSDLPLLLYSSMVLLAYVLWKLGQEYTPALRAITKVQDGEGDVLQHRIESLQRKAAEAERQWAAAVLEERAKRIAAERLARQFAEVRKEKEPLQPLSLREAFAVFGLRQGCTAEQLRDAYRHLISQHHPDKVAALGPILREVAERETRRINAAFAMAIPFAVTVSPNAPASQTPLHAIVCCPGVSGPNGFHRGSTGTSRGRSGAAMP